MRLNIARTKKIAETTKYSFAGSHNFLNEDILYTFLIKKTEAKYNSFLHLT
jgi:hypothetical protein